MKDEKILVSAVALIVVAALASVITAIGYREDVEKSNPIVIDNKVYRCYGQVNQ